VSNESCDRVCVFEKSCDRVCVLEKSCDRVCVLEKSCDCVCVFEKSCDHVRDKILHLPRLIQVLNLELKYIEKHSDSKQVGT
jgi:hypothetical protein